MGDTPPDYMSGASCAMCGSGVHYVEGRVGCNACSLPTDCCLCPPQLTAPVAPLELNAGTSNDEAPPRRAGRTRAR
ncbi:MAG TPA: hypothetical protein VM264_05595 [Acidimicrobiales bacterium]|nr:hypothetical protein [Acidimicrobiales bacterium]